MTHYDEEFDQVDSGASLTIPISAGSIKKGGHMLINGRPCKVNFIHILINILKIYSQIILNLNKIKKNSKAKFHIKTTKKILLHFY